MSRLRYTNINKDPYKKETPPVPVNPVPTESEYAKGSFVRYFVRSKQDNTIIIEIDKKQFDTITQKDIGINQALYEGISTRWRVRGRKHDEYANGIRTYPGVYESNERFVEKLKRNFPQMTAVLRNFTEHAIIENGSSSNQRTNIVDSHFHYVYIDDMGNGHTSWHTNPKNPNIKHYHEIRDFVIMEAQDNCWPTCFSLYGYEGLGPHTHETE